MTPKLGNLILFIFLSAAIIRGSENTALSQKQINQPPTPNTFLQLSSKGHKLAFHMNGISISSGNFTLKASFVGTKGAAPIADYLNKEDNKIQSLEKVSYPDLWKGITLTYDRPAGEIIRSTYLVEPGADPGRIALQYNTPVQLDEEGNLVFKIDEGVMKLSAPIAWQEVDGKCIPINVSFHLDKSKSTVHFNIAEYDPSIPLIIDPTLKWNTFLGSSDEGEYGIAITVDNSGNVYLTGLSFQTWGTPINDYDDLGDAFAAKLNSSGELQWNTFLGSSSEDYGSSIVLDNWGNIYVAGDSGASWGNPVNAHSGEEDAFVVKLNNSGETVWNTFLGSSSSDYCNGVTVDDSGNIYITGLSGHPVNDLTPSNYDMLVAKISSDVVEINYDAFIAKINPNGETVWNTFLGSTGNDFGNGIALDDNGNLYVIGDSENTWGNPVNPHSGGTDAFVVKLTNSGETIWNTFLGSASIDIGDAIAIGDNHNIYISGTSLESWGNPVNNHAGNFDAFAAKLNSSGELQWNTFMGSSDSEFGKTGITLNNLGIIYIAGISYATWGNPKYPHSGGQDIFTAKLNNSSGKIVWNTFMGTTMSLVGNRTCIVINENRFLYVTAFSEADWGNPVNPYAGNADAFVVKIIDTALNPGASFLLINSSDD